MIEELTEQDVNVLMEAIDAWITSAKSTRLLAGLFIGALSAEKDGVDAAQKKFEEISNGGEDENTRREEVAILLKAKLLKIRDRIVASEFGKSAGG